MRDNDSADRVRLHTLSRIVPAASSPGVRRTRTAPAAVMECARHGSRCAAILCTFVALCACSAHAAEWRDIRARVIWTRESYVYVAADSGTLSPGMPLEFLRGKKHVGTALLARLLEPGVAVARLHEGSLAGEKRLDKLRVRAGAAPAAPHGSLRVGLPAPARKQLLFACGTPRWNPGLGGYAADTLERGVVALRRAPGDVASGSEPETLLVRFFADAADQEIALERGELDVAVFWPGELSARMRADARWHAPVLAKRARGVLACSGASADSLRPDPEALAMLQRDVFSGDLEPLGTAPSAGAAPVRLARVEPDSSLPGAAAIARVLARAGRSGPALRLVYLASDAAGGATASLQPVFAMRCAVLVAPSLRAGWPAHDGAVELANLLQCDGPR